VTLLPRASIECVAGPQRGRIVRVDVEPFSIGRSEDNALVLPKPSVPEHMAILARGADRRWRIQVVDPSSSVRIGGTETRDGFLRDGDLVEIAGSSWRLREGASAAPHAAGAGRRLSKRLLWPAVVGAAVVALAVGVWVGARFKAQPAAPADPAGLKAQGMNLIKDREWGKALEVLGAVLTEGGPDPEAQILVAQVESEIRNKRLWEEARLLREREGFKEALAVLEQIPAASAYAPEAATLRKEIRKNITARHRSEARARMERKEWAEARQAARSSLQWEPRDSDGLQLIREIDRREKLARTTGRTARPPVREKGSETPAWVEPYLAGDWQAVRTLLGKDLEGKADESKTLRAKEVLGWLEAIEGALREGNSLAKAGKIPEASSHWEKAVSLERGLALRGQSRPVAELGKRLADESARLGQESFAQKAYPAALQQWLGALRHVPEHEAARQGLARLRKIAQNLYEEAYRLEGADRKAALRKYEEVLRIVPEEDEFHRKAKERLEAAGR
jgi:tetratricopeptide (TPR) repeat protein